MFKKSLAILLALGLTLSASPSYSLPVQQAKKYSNCKALNKVYPGGVAKSKSVRNKGGITKKKPKVSAALYAANKSKDRDRDGIACER